MELLAIGLLALGVIFVLIGVVSGLNRTRPPEHVAPPVQQPQQPQEPQNQTPLSTQNAQNNQFTHNQGNLSLHVSSQNPVFFEKDAYMYLDYNHNNVYNGVHSSFKIMDTTGIRRFGLGEFSYNGFAFKFKNNQGQEEFPLETIDHVSVYPNCVAISFISKNPVALFFVDNTKEIRSILDTFRINNAS